MQALKNVWNKGVDLFMETPMGAQIGVVGGAVMAANEAVYAAVDPSVGTGLTGLVTDATTLAGLVTAAVVSIMFLGLGIRLVKKMGSKAV